MNSKKRGMITPGLPHELESHINPTRHRCYANSSLIELASRPH